jgi:hypothetical protein
LTHAISRNEWHSIGIVAVPARLFRVQNFYLHHVLALTDYHPPQSAFGGMFGDGGGFGGDAQPFSRYQGAILSRFLSSLMGPLGSCIFVSMQK